MVHDFYKGLSLYFTQCIEKKLSAMPWWHCAAFLILFVLFIALEWRAASEKIICLSKLEMQGVHHW